MTLRLRRRLEQAKPVADVFTFAVLVEVVASTGFALVVSAVMISDSSVPLAEIPVGVAKVVFAINSFVLGVELVSYPGFPTVIAAGTSIFVYGVAAVIVYLFGRRFDLRFANEIDRLLSQIRS